jgi:hypothetical protein
MLVLLALVFSGQILSAQEDIKGSKGHPLFTRMPNYYIYEYKETEFD